MSNKYLFNLGTTAQYFSASCIDFGTSFENDEEKYEQIIKMGRNIYYATGNLLDYEYFSKHYKLTALDLSKQIELENPDLKQQINFIGRRERYEEATTFFIFEKSKNFHKEFSQNGCLILTTYKTGNTKNCKFVR